MSPAALRTNRTPSARSRAESTPFVTPQGTPRTRKRVRAAASILDQLREIDEAEGSQKEEEEEEEGGEEDEVEEVDIEERIAQQSYETAWRCVDHRNKLVKVYSTLCSGRENVYDKVFRWACIEAAKRSSTVGRMNFTVSAKGQPRSEYWVSDIDSSIDYEDVVRQKALQVQEVGGYEEVRMSVIAHLEKEEAEPKATSSTTANRRPKKKKRRLTATQQQELQADDALEDATNAGDYSLLLRTKWVCSVTSCPNHHGSANGYCYWITSNTKDGHYPLIASAVKEWSREIRKGDSTEDKPSDKVLEMLFSAKNRLLSHSHNHRARSQTSQMPQGGGGGPMPIYNTFIGASAAEILGQQAQQRQEREAEPPSSAPTETPPLEVLKALFQYCKNSVAWQGFEADLSAIEVALHDNGYDIDGIKSLTAVDWQEMGL